MAMAMAADGVGNGSVVGNGNSMYTVLYIV